MNRSVFHKAFLASVPVLTGYLAIGFAFGILLRDAGYGVGIALAMSVFVFAGSMQYVAVGLLSGGASLLSFALTTLLVNGRHFVYGLSMLEPYRDAGAKKPYLIFGLSDETYSLVSSAPAFESRREKQWYCFFITLLDQCYWVTGSVIGSLLGAVLPFSTEGFDFALTAMFITIVLDQWRSAARHLPALLGAGAALLCLLLFGPSNFLIPAMVTLVFLLLLLKDHTEEVAAP